MERCPEDKQPGCAEFQDRFSGGGGMTMRRFAVAIGIGLLLLPAVAVAQTRVQFEASRRKMVEEVIVGSGITNERVIQAMQETPRHEFVAGQYRKNAYLDMALPIGNSQTISPPFVVASMTEAIDPQPDDKVLEIGTGSGFQAAVLSPLVKDVYTIEIVEPLGERAKRTLKRLGYDNVHTKIGDGFQGWPEHAPFDKIIVTCSPEKVPQPLADQLAEGGLMVVPVGERYQQTLYLFRKKEGKLQSEALLPTLFVPMTGKAEDAREVKPDPAHPRVANGSFEEPAFKSGAQPGWYYERHITWESDEGAPDGKHYVTFKNSEPGLSAHLLQGLGIDGRQVQQLEISGSVKYSDVVRGNSPDELPYISITLYDAQRRQLGNLVVGPFVGTSQWHRESKIFRIPPTAREGILRIGLFGATGTASFDDMQIRRVDGKD
jgi:protein-L-isoaspartate(D-aspartate) O-methyltransferase